MPPAQELSVKVANMGQIHSERKTSRTISAMGPLPAARHSDEAKTQQQPTASCLRRLVAFAVCFCVALAGRVLQLARFFSGLILQICRMWYMNFAIVNSSWNAQGDL